MLLSQDQNIQMPLEVLFCLTIRANPPIYTSALPELTFLLKKINKKGEGGLKDLVLAALVSSDGRGSLKCSGLAERISDHAEALEVSGAAVSATQKV